MLKVNRAQVYTPTIQPNTDELVVGSLKLKIFDLGGHETARRLWEDYFATVDAVVFLVDATDRTRFPEARKELNAMFLSPDLEGVPFLVLGNKVDLPHAVSEQDLKHELGLFDTFGQDKGPTDYEVRPVEVYMCSVLRRMGYADGFQWLSQFLS